MLLLFKILNAATTILKRVSVRILKISSVFIEANQNFNFYFLHNKAAKTFENHRRMYKYWFDFQDRQINY
jgi:hypothetical protein